MSFKRQKNIVDIPEARKFLLEVYGMKTQIINEYHLRGWVEGLDGFWDWYHTTGTLLLFKIDKNGIQRQIQLGKNQYPDEEDVAVKINQLIEKEPKDIKKEHYFI